jgi:hypothetical protein
MTKPSVISIIHSTLIKDRLIMFISAWILIFFIYAELTNETIHHFKPIFYKPPNFLCILVLGICLPICCHFSAKLSPFKEMSRDFTFFSFTLLLGTLAINACQLSPFPTIDPILAKIEFLPITRYMMWLKSHPTLYLILTKIYNSLDFVLILTPFVAYALGQAVFYKFCRFFLIACMVGFTVYYFFPSCGPASVFPAKYFLTEQHANHTKFWEIHHGITASTEAGGLIAFPSFHVIWAWNCIRIFLGNKMIFSVYLIWFLLTCLSTVLLGWHYSIDVLGSIFFIICIEYLLKDNQKFITN